VRFPGRKIIQISYIKTTNKMIDQRLNLKVCVKMDRKGELSFILITLLLLPPLRFNCVGEGCDQIQDYWQSNALTTRLDVISMDLHNPFSFFLKKGGSPEVYFIPDPGIGEHLVHKAAEYLQFVTHTAFRRTLLYKIRMQYTYARKKITRYRYDRNVF
jgi:hypothetical protein